MLKRTKGLKRSGTLKKKSSLKAKPKSQEQKDKDKEGIERQWQLFQKVWDERGPYSEVSREYLGKECKTIFCHHIWPKSRVEQGRYDPENIILLTWDEHERVENDPFKYIEVNIRREKLKAKYGII